MRLWAWVTGRSRCLAAWLAFMPLVTMPAVADESGQRALPLDQIASGYAFQSTDTQALQDDDFANPGFLWLDRGAALWQSPAGKTQRACADCHGPNGDDLKGNAARYPAFDPVFNRVINLEQRINACRQRHQQAAPLAYESDELLALTAYVANLSKGRALDIAIDGPARPVFEAGKQAFFTRRGQLNLACHHCHNRNWGEMLRGDQISQGHGNGYPAYRFEWQSLGSLHRRLRACNLGVRAEPLDYGSPDYIALELYLAWRAGDLEIETPAVRR
ncbi:MAG: sulfur oxidation c-type cytochrome SoxA [Geminicoccaceae bacterium]